MRSLILAALGGAAAMLLLVDDAAAKEAGDWIIRAGITHIAPKSNNGSIDDGEGGVINLDVGTATMMTFDGTYMVTNNFGVELLAALPFKHDIKGHADGTNAKLATVKQLPPTLSAVYHFNTQNKVQPYVGAGVNWTIFFDEKEKGPLADPDLDASLKVKNSVGLAAVVGIDFALTDNVYLNGNIRYMNIEPDVSVTIPDAGGDVVLKTKVKVNPIVYGLNLGWQF